MNTWYYADGFGVCPDAAVVKLGPDLRYGIDYDYRKGAGSAPRNARASRSG